MRTYTLGEVELVAKKQSSYPRKVVYYATGENIVNAKRTHTFRPLYAWEVQEARRVFSNGLNYGAIRIHENASWPNTINKIGTWLKRMPQVDAPNAITLFNHCYFPVQLLEVPVPLNHPDDWETGWLIHELTHAWQYQHLGRRYLFKAVVAQLRLGAKVYEFGGEAGLVKSHSLGQKLADFNMEQQGDIARTYYEALIRGKDVSAWLPFIAEFQQKDNG